jgi:hypothetical protein
MYRHQWFWTVLSYFAPPRWLTHQSGVRLRFAIWAWLHIWRAEKQLNQAHPYVQRDGRWVRT